MLCNRSKHTNKIVKHRCWGIVVIFSLKFVALHSLIPSVQSTHSDTTYNDVLVIATIFLRDQLSNRFSRFEQILITINNSD